MDNSDIEDKSPINLIVLGKICGHFGVKGWVKMVSYTRPADQIFQYDSWTLAGSNDAGGSDDQRFWLTTEVSAFKQHAKGGGKNWVVKLAGYDSREATQMLIGKHIGIDQSQLEPLAKGDYYWLDLIGLRVVNLEGVILGNIDHLMETGANDVMVVHCESSHAVRKNAVIKDAVRKNVVIKNAAIENVGEERLLPWTSDVVMRVDLESGVVTVDWKEYY